MGCVVNGPGEAREADIGVAGGNGMGILFKKGQVVKKFPEDRLVDVVLERLTNLSGNQNHANISLNRNRGPFRVERFNGSGFIEDLKQGNPKR
jgi:hypothetical protein